MLCHHIEFQQKTKFEFYIAFELVYLKKLMFLFCYKRKCKGSFYGIQDNASRHQTERNGKIIWPVFFQREQRNESELWDSLRPLYFAFDCTYISFHCSVHQNE